ncbi:MAG: DUF433 domain-containing protein [Armatimonadetes bacterium]|nr:DUF433 domain-containing protein [Armatimonadota bacterium]
MSTLPGLLDIDTPERPPLRTDDHGIVRVGATRVPLENLVYSFREGLTAEEIALNYSSVALADVYAALTYYLRHQAEVDAYLLAREAQDAQIRREWEARFPQDALRERVRARRAALRRDA